MHLISSVSVVVPAYNSAPTLRILVSRVSSVLDELELVYEIILVNDNSQDDTWDRIVELAHEYSHVHGISLMRNFGQHNALLCGIRAAKYECVVTIDDDLQNPPEEIPKLLNQLNAGYDVVYGTPEYEQHGLWRDMASRMTKMALQSSMGVETARNVSAFRILRTQVREAFSEYRGPFVSIDVLLTWGTTRFSAIPVRHDPRRVGKSNYTFRKLLSHTLNMLTGFSVLPLQLASLVGFAFTVFGMGVLVYVLARFIIQGGSVPGFPFIASIVSIFSGAQLFALGIIGEYLARMHFRMMDRPAYIVRSSTPMSPSAPPTRMAATQHQQQSVAAYGGKHPREDTVD